MSRKINILSQLKGTSISQEKAYLIKTNSQKLKSSSLQKKLSIITDPQTPTDYYSQAKTAKSNSINNLNGSTFQESIKNKKRGKKKKFKNLKSSESRLIELNKNIMKYFSHHEKTCSVAQEYNLIFEKKIQQIDKLDTKNYVQPKLQQNAFNYYQ